MNEKKEYRGYAASVLLHILTGLLFLGINMDLSPLMPEFFEVTFTTLTAGNAMGQIRRQPPPEVERTAAKETAAPKVKEIVELPKRTMKDPTEPDISVAQKEKISIKNAPARIGEKIEISREPEREELENISDILSENENDIEHIRMSADVEDVTNNNGANISPYQSFSIKWVGNPREKLRGELPEYPKGLNKTATIQLRFKVFPDGAIGDIVPLKKGDTILENIAIQALKKWQFNALETAAPQEMQEGIIVFIFKLI